MADKLAIWKQALVHLGSAPIASLTDSVQSVNVFNSAWLGVVEEAFSEGDWNFAKKSVGLTQSGTPAVGWTYAFPYPDDYLRTVEVSDSALFNHPFITFQDQGGELYGNNPNLYLRYISNEKIAYETTWPTMFWRYVAIKLAYETCERITQSSAGQDRLERRLMLGLRKAKSVDARNEQNSVLDEGSWLRARRGGVGPGRESASTLGGEIILADGDV